MNSDLVDKIARAVLYEGYILYPYRPSALKNRSAGISGCYIRRPSPLYKQAPTVRIFKWSAW